MKKILVLGVNSFTGSNLKTQLAGEYEIFGTSRLGEGLNFAFDAMTDSKDTLVRLISEKNIDVVINCISLGDVDACEAEKDVCKKLNYDFVVELSKIQSELDFQLIHFSTNAVYSGDVGYYSEVSECSPVNFYGKTKLEADLYLLKNSKRVTILRPITMYGSRLDDQRHNPFSFFLDSIIANKDITAVNDVYVNFLFINDLVKCVKKAIDESILGLYNISGDTNINRVGFAKLVLDCVPSSCTAIKSVSSDKFPTIATRPKDTSFNNQLMKNVFGVKPKPIHETIKMLVTDKVG